MASQGVMTLDRTNRKPFSCRYHDVAVVLYVEKFVFVFTEIE